MSEAMLTGVCGCFSPPVCRRRAERRSDGSCPVLKEAPVGRNARAEVVIKRRGGGAS